MERDPPRRLDDPRAARRAAMTRSGRWRSSRRALTRPEWGIPASMVGDVDKIALWNIVTTVDADPGCWLHPGRNPQSIHPSLVGCSVA